MIKHTKRGLKADMKRRSAENWERGVGARKIGNPRYKPSTCKKKVKGRYKRVKCYRVR